MNIAEKLREARLSIGLTQTQVEEMSGVNKRTISNYECGVSKPDVETLSKLCSLYKISSDEIISVPLSDQDARNLYKQYVKSPRNIQEIVETALKWKPPLPAHSREGREPQ
jgi:transcriptional regulator with XRE-family HTH domain